MPTDTTIETQPSNPTTTEILAALDVLSPALVRDLHTQDELFDADARDFVNGQDFFEPLWATDEVEALREWLRRYVVAHESLTGSPWPAHVPPTEFERACARVTRTPKSRTL